MYIIQHKKERLTNSHFLLVCWLTCLQHVQFYLETGAHLQWICTQMDRSPGIWPKFSRGWIHVAHLSKFALIYNDHISRSDIKRTWWRQCHFRSTKVTGQLIGSWAFWPFWLKIRHWRSLSISRSFLWYIFNHNVPNF